MTTPGPVLEPTTAADQGGATVFDRLKGLTESWNCMKPLLVGLYPEPAAAPAKEARVCCLRPNFGTKTGTPSS